MLRTAQLLPPTGLSTLSFDPARYQTEPPACYRAPWQLPGRDSHPLAAASLCSDQVNVIAPPPKRWAHADDSRIGTELAGYRIEAALGRGGMSVVYLAEDLRLHRKVALKLITPELAEDERFRERFLAESELAASLDHPNVVPIYEACEAEGVLFIALRYVEGEDLKELLGGGALLPERAIALCAQIASALDAAHARGLVHRDVKPSNVLIDPTAGPAGHVYLADFGLTRRLSEQ